MSRYSYSLAILKSCSGHLYKFREAAKAKANDQATTLIKEMMERIKNATIRIYKMWGTEAIILVGISNQARTQRKNRSTRILPRVHGHHEKVSSAKQGSSKLIILD